MIVIVIIGVVYTLAVTKLQSVGEEVSTPTLGTLKEYLISLNKEHTGVRLLCLDDCSECNVYKDDVKVQSIENLLDSSVERYRYDFLEGSVLLRDEVYFNAEGRDENICFSFSIDKNNISDQIIVVYKDKAYDYTSYFSKAEVYDSIEELIEIKEKQTQEVMQ